MENTKKNYFIVIKNWLIEQLADKGFWHSIIGAFIGGILAIFAGLTVYSIQIHHQQAQELEIKNQQKIILLEGFKKSLEDNINIMNQITNPQDAGIAINNVNLNYFISTAQIKYQDLDNIPLAEELDDLTFRLNSLEQAIKNFQGIYFNPLSATNTRFLATRGRELRMNIDSDTRQTILIATIVLRNVELELEKLHQNDGRSKSS